MPTQKAALMVTRFTTMLQKLVQTARAGGKPLVFEQVSIAANGTKDYNLNDLFPDNANWDMRSCRVQCWLLDDQAGSDTETYFINAESTVVGGVKSTGVARIRLYRGTGATVLVRIDRPVKKLP